MKLVTQIRLASSEVRIKDNFINLVPGRVSLLDLAGLPSCIYNKITLWLLLSGLVGGSNPVFDEVIISTSRMNKIISIDDTLGKV